MSILQMIPTMNIHDTVHLWQNAVRVLDNPQALKQHGLAQSIIDAIGKEWERRRYGANSGDGFKWPTTGVQFGNGHLETGNWIKRGYLACSDTKWVPMGDLKASAKRPCVMYS